MSGERVDLDLLEAAREALEWVPEPEPGWEPRQFIAVDPGLGEALTAIVAGKVVRLPPGAELKIHQFATPPVHPNCRCEALGVARHDAKAWETVTIDVGAGSVDATFSRQYSRAR